MAPIAQFKLDQLVKAEGIHIPVLQDLVDLLNKNFGYIAYGGNDEAWYIEIIGEKKDWNVRNEMFKRPEDILNIIEVKYISTAKQYPYDPMSGGWRGRSTANAIEFIAVDPLNGMNRHFKFSHF